MADPVAREQERAKRRRERIAIAVVAVLVAALTILEAKLARIGGPGAFRSNVLVFALINLNIVFIVLLIFLVTRNLFKIIIDRRRGILGARLRSRLVLIFLLFTLVPTSLLFFAATNITTTSIKSWIGGRVGTALTGAIDVARRGLEERAAAMSGAADRAAAAVPRGAGPESARRALRRARGGETAATLLLVDGGAVIAVDGDASAKVRREAASRAAAGVPPGRGGKATIVGEDFAAAARRTADGRVVVALKELSAAEARQIRDIVRAYDAYHQVRLLDDPIRTSYVGLLVLITLLIVFAASWMGIYLARQITIPVQLLAEGTEKVATGDLDVRIDYRSADELGHLVSSFNRMTADLKAMKGNLEAANVSLAETYDELRRRTRFIETILTNISTGVVVIDRQGRIAMINRVAERLLGVPTDQVLGHPYRDVFREEHYEAVRALTRAVGETAGAPVERQVAVDVEGKRVALRVSVTALEDDKGEYAGLVVAFDDLSQAMRLQRVMAWREVARRIAHEIRNPLTPIRLSTERLGRRYAEAHAGDPAFAECTRTILSEVDSLRRLVDEFTRFARMPAPVFKKGNLAGEARSVVETFRAAHPALRFDVDGGDVPDTWFDPFQLRRALLNLLENAAAALGGSGAVSVSCAHDPGGGTVTLAVADDGPGIPPEDRERLFEPYFSRKEGGTGLGLAIVSAVASDHGGTVRVRDNVPRGAVFEIEIPARQAGREEG